MRESRTYGSVRGALSNERPYRVFDAGSIALHLAVDDAGGAQVRAQFLGSRAIIRPDTHMRPTHASAAKAVVNDERLAAAQYGRVFLLHSAICH